MPKPDSPSPDVSGILLVFSLKIKRYSEQREGASKNPKQLPESSEGIRCCHKNKTLCM